MNTDGVIAILMPSLAGGGTERVLLHLGEELVRRGHRVELLVTRIRPGHDRPLPPALPVRRLAKTGDLRARFAALRAVGREWPKLVLPVLLPRKSSWTLRYMPALQAYLREHRPAALISGNSWSNLSALWARRGSGVQTRVVVTEHVHLSQRVGHLGSRWRWKFLPDLIGHFYRDAQGIVGVSDGVSRDLARRTGLPETAIDTIWNPAVTPALLADAARAPPHGWLATTGRIPVVIAMGRLHPQKDFANLLRAFAKVLAQRQVRLIVLGEGAERLRLEALAATLGIREHVLMPGFVEHPAAWLAHASLFVLSSRYEGLSNAVIEALACACPVVSTDCPSGPAEVLEHGRYGSLVPVGDPDAMAAAVLRDLDRVPDREALRARGLDFSVARATDAYLRILLPGKRR